MKLGRKLFVIFAALAIATPTFAGTNVVFTQNVAVVKPNTDYASYGYIKLDFDSRAVGNIKFQVKLENAEWPSQQELREKISEVWEEGKIKDAMEINTSKVFRLSEQIIEVQIEQLDDRNKHLYLPLFTRVGKGNARVSIESFNTCVTDLYPTVFARTDLNKALVDFGKPSQLIGEGGIGDITIKEPEEGIIGRQDNKITISLEQDDYRFDKQAITKSIRKGKSRYFVFQDGFAQFELAEKKEEDGEEVLINFNYDEQEITLTFDRRSDYKPGKVILNNLPVVCYADEPEEDYQLEVTVEGEDIEKTRGTVASAEHGDITINTSNKVPTVISGETVPVSFTVQQGSYTGSITNEYLELRLTGGYFLPHMKTDYIEAAKHLKDGKVNHVASPLQGATLNEIDLNRQLREKMENSSAVRNESVQITEWIWENDRAVGVKCKIKKKMPSYTFTNIPVYTPLTWEGSASIESTIGETTASTQVLQAKMPLAITSDRIILRRSTKPQAGGALTMKENKAGVLKQEGVIEIALDNPVQGLTFVQKPMVSVTSGNMQIKPEDITYGPDRIRIKIAKESTIPSTISISQFPMQVPKNTSFATYGVVVKGDAMPAPKGLDTFYFKKMIDIGEGNDIDYNTTGLKTGVSRFTIGSKYYWANGIQKEMDAMPYISSKGRVMLPVKYVSSAIGVDSGSVIVMGNQITILAGNNTVVLQKGSNKALLNNVEIILDEVITIKNGRAYVPASQIGRLLGVDSKWDGSTKTAIFSN